MGTDIHRSAVVEDGAEVGEGCRIGPHCYVGPHARLGRDNLLHSNVVVDGHTVLGDGNEIFSFACLGKTSQDLKFRKEWVSHSRIGDGNVFREYATVNASSAEGGSTVVGSGCLLLSYSHVAHDCVVGDHVIVSSDTKMAGHVEIGDHAIVGAKTGVVQFVKIGQHAFVGGFSKVAKDVLPFCIAEGIPAAIRAVNRVGLERRGFSAETIGAIEDAFRTLIRSGLLLDEALPRLAEKHPDVAEVQAMIAFARGSKTGLARPRERG